MSSRSPFRIRHPAPRKMTDCPIFHCNSKPLLTVPLLILSSLFLLRLFRPSYHISTHLSVQHTPPYTLQNTSSPTTLHHLVFGIASSSNSWPNRSNYVRLWYDPQSIRACVFLDRIPYPDAPSNSSDLPPVRISEDTSRFPYTFPRGLRSAIRVARIVSEIVATDLPDVRWIVLGDDDTVFFPENLVAALGKYDWEGWYYVGGNSESLEQNLKYSFRMAFGGGGFAVSYPLARVLASVLDSCLVRYAHLYGSDARIFSCLAELGVGLTQELGFHQVDIRGDLFGMLSAHPLAPLISLHHLDIVEPIFPNMTRLQALEHLFEAVKADPGRILQQTVCYDRLNSQTISVAWGYAVQVYEGNRLLPDLLPLQQTFMPWKRSRDISSSQYTFNSREFPRDPCKRPATFFLESVFLDSDGIQTNYRRYIPGNCLLSKAPQNSLEHIKVFSEQFDLDIRQLQAPRRHCCDVLPSSFDKVMEIGIRKCKGEELIAMNL